MNAADAVDAADANNPHASASAAAGAQWKARFGGQTEATAQEVASECCVAEWLRCHRQRSDSGRCARCGEAESYGRVVVPFGTGRHVWLHHACWRDWYRHRREQARLAFACLGIRPPAANSADTKSSNDLGGV